MHSILACNVQICVGFWAFPDSYVYMRKTLKFPPSPAPRRSASIFLTSNVSHCLKSLKICPANYHFCDLIEMWYVQMFWSTLSTPHMFRLLLVNYELLCDVNRLHVSLWPSLRHPKWFNVMTVRYHRDHTVILSRDHDFSCQILPVVIIMLRIFFIFSTDVTGHLSVRLTRTVPVTWRSFCSFMKWIRSSMKRIHVR